MNTLSMKSDIAGFLEEIISSLLVLDPDKIILFGSRCGVKYDDDSDYDILVILNSKCIPKSYDEKISLKTMVRKSVFELSRRKPIDLVVYTSAEFALLKNQKTSFYSEIANTGITLYEKAI